MPADTGGENELTQEDREAIAEADWSELVPLEAVLADFGLTREDWEKMGDTPGDVDELTAEDRRAVTASRDYFRQGGQGIPFEQVVAECGFTMDQIRKTADPL